MRRNRRLSNRLGVIVESRLTISISSFLQIKTAKRLADKHLAMYAEGFFFVFSGAIFGIRWFESFCLLNGSISKKLFLGFRGFESLRRMDGSVLEGTICKQFVSNAKKRKNLKPCRGFKSFRSLAFRIQFLKNRIFGSSNPSTRKNTENGSMEIRKKFRSKKEMMGVALRRYLPGGSTPCLQSNLCIIRP